MGNVTIDTILRASCRDDGHTGGFISTIIYDDNMYSTVNPMSDSNWIPISVASGDYNISADLSRTATYIPEIGYIAENAVWCWNDFDRDTIIFEFDFQNILPKTIVLPPIDNGNGPITYTSTSQPTFVSDRNEKEIDGSSITEDNNLIYILISIIGFLVLMMIICCLFCLCFLKNSKRIFMETVNDKEETNETAQEGDGNETIIDTKTTDFSCLETYDTNIHGVHHIDHNQQPTLTEWTKTVAWNSIISVTHENDNADLKFLSKAQRQHLKEQGTAGG